MNCLFLFFLFLFLVGRIRAVFFMDDTAVSTGLVGWLNSLSLIITTEEVEPLLIV